MNAAPFTSVPRQGWRPAGVSWLLESASLLMSAAEGIVIWLFLASALGTDGGVLPAGIVIGLTVFGTMAPRILNAFDIWPPWYEIIIAVLILISTLGAIKVFALPTAAWTDPAWTGSIVDGLILRGPSVVRIWSMVLLSALVWWRGQRRDDPTLDSANATLRAGVPLFVLGLLAYTAAGSPTGDAAATAAGAGFFAATLGAISIARHAADRATRSSSGETAMPVSPAAVIVPVLVVLAVGAISSGLATRELLDTIILVLSPVVWALMVILRALVLVVAAISFLLALPFIWLLNQIDPEGQTFIASGTPVPGDELIRPVAERSIDLPDPVRYVVVGVVLALLFATAIAFRMRHPRPTFIVGGEERESTFGLGRILGDLGSSLKALLRRTGEVDSLAILRRDSRWAHTVAIREIYRQLLIWAGERGVGRRPSETPYRHAGRMDGELRTASGEDLATIITRYNRARYGAAPASAREAEEVREAWRRLQRGEERTS